MPLVMWVDGRFGIKRLEAVVERSKIKQTAVAEFAGGDGRQEHPRKQETKQIANDRRNRSLSGLREVEVGKDRFCVTLQIDSY